MNTHSFPLRILSLFFLVSCFLLAVSTPVFGEASKSVKLGWAPNEENDLAGYRVYHGIVSGQYSNSTDVGLHDTYVVPDLDPNKTHYFAITAYDKNDNESIPSPEVYKKFLPDYFPLTISLQGHGAVQSSSAGATCSSGSCTNALLAGTKVTLTATPNDGAKFSGWSGACGGTENCVVTLDAAQQVTATFIPLPTMLTLQVTGLGRVVSTTNEGDLVCPQSTCIVEMAYGAKATLAATPNEGAKFSGWSGACSGTDSCVVAMDAAQQVMATFTPTSTVLTMQVTGLGRVHGVTNEGDIACPRNTCKVEMPYGMKATLAATPNEGAEFSGWSGACSGNDSCVVAMDAAQQVTATFTPISTVLTMQVTGLGRVHGVTNEGDIACPRNTCKVEMPYGTKVTLTATPNDGAEFSGWSGACRGAASCDVVLKTPQQVMATFKLEESVSGISDPPPGSTLTDTSVTLTGGHSSGDVQHSLWVGTTKGGRNLFKGPIANHRQLVSGLPSQGTIYVRYWSLRSKDSSNLNAWSFKDHVYRMGLDTSDKEDSKDDNGSFPPSLNSPAPGATLTNTSVTFAGGHTSGDSMHALWVGTTQGGRNLFKGPIVNHRQLVTGLPRQGTIYVRYWSLKGKNSSSASGWSFKDHVYRMGLDTSDKEDSKDDNGSFPPSLNSPAPGATLTNTSVTFAGGHTSGDSMHALWVGTTQGGRNLFKGPIVNHRQLVTGLPRQGTIYVRYWSLKGKNSSSASGWSFKDHVYRMGLDTSDKEDSKDDNGSFPPSLNSPAPGATLTNTSVTFAGGHTSKDGMHALWVGTAKGGRNVFSGPMSNHRKLVSGLPTRGTIYVRYWSLKGKDSRNGSAWSFQDYTYTMNAGGK